MSCSESTSENNDVIYTNTALGKPALAFKTFPTSRLDSTHSGLFFRVTGLRPEATSFDWKSYDDVIGNDFMGVGR